MKRKTKILFTAIALIVMYRIFFVMNIPSRQDDEHNVFDRGLFYGLVNSSDSSEVLNALVDEADFRHFMLGSPGEGLRSRRVQFIDTTGDGIKEEVISVVDVTNKRCNVSHVINSGGQPIWSSSFTLDKFDLNRYFRRSFPANQVNKALFYLGLTFESFTDFLPESQIHEKVNNPAYSRLYSVHNLALHIGQNYPSSNPEAAFVFLREPGKEGIYTWSGASGGFIFLGHPFNLAS